MPFGDGTGPLWAQGRGRRFGYFCRFAGQVSEEEYKKVLEEEKKWIEEELKKMEQQKE